jgi:hypothetical protein
MDMDTWEKMGMGTCKRHGHGHMNINMDININTWTCTHFDLDAWT